MSRRLLLVALVSALVAFTCDNVLDRHSHDNSLLDSAVVEDRLNVALRDVAFSPGEIDIAHGVVVEITVSNEGAAAHDFTIERISADVAVSGPIAAGHEAHGHQFDVHLAVEPGETATLRLRANDPGTYVYYCTMPGHRDLGMEGTLTVR